MILALTLCLAAVAALCWLIFTCAVYALPLSVGALAALAVHRSGGGMVGAVAVGGFAAALTLVLGQQLFARAPSTFARALLIAAFAAPAGFAAYHAVHGLTASLVPSPAWRELFSVAAGVIVATSAILRLRSAPAGDAGRARVYTLVQRVRARPANDH